MFRSSKLVLLAAVCVNTSSAFAQMTDADYAKFDHSVSQLSPLFFREVWKVIPGQKEQPVLPENVGNPKLELKLYGPSGAQIRMGPGTSAANDPPHLWTGRCEQTCAATLRHKDSYVDLSGLGKIAWFIKTSGLHRVHPIIKLADGTWYVAEHGDSNVADYHPHGFTLSETRWIQLDIDRVVTRGLLLNQVDLRKVDEIGFTTLMPGSGHGQGGYMDMGWFEVFGKSVPRTGN